MATPSTTEGGGGGKGGDKDKDGPVLCLKGISVSAWNPPPPQRKMVGDLMYLEVCGCFAAVLGGHSYCAVRTPHFNVCECLCIQDLLA